MSKFTELRDFVATLEKDFDKFYTKGNKAAGTRVRKAMQELKGKAQAIREDVSNLKHAD